MQPYVLHAFSFFSFFFYSNMVKGKGVNLQTNRTSMEKVVKHKYKQEIVGNGDHL
jgi:hypothetical protein